MSYQALGVDPSFNRTGWAVVECIGDEFRTVDAGLIASRGAERSQQLLSISDQFLQVLQVHEIDGVYFERPGAWQRKGGSRPETLELLSMSRAVMLLACAWRDIPAQEIDVQVVRRSLIGRANAREAEILQFVASQGLSVPLRPRGKPDDDVANAMVMALYGLGHWA